MKNWLMTMLCLAIAAPAVAQQNFDELIEKVRDGRRELSTSHQSGESAMDLAALRERLAATEAALDLATRQRDELDAQFGASQDELQTMLDALRRETADMSQFFGVIRQFAADTGGALKTSLVSAQLGSRAGLPDRLSAAGSIPAPGELDQLHLTLLEEMMQSGQVMRFDAEVVDAAGVPATIPVVRVGMFNLLSGDSFLRFEPGNGTIQQLVRQPARHYRNDAERLFNATNKIVAMPIDPTGGQLLSLLIQTPKFSERIGQGGWVGYLIIALGLAGLLIGAYRLLFLGMAGAAINKQLDSDTPCTTNALGRILSVYSHNTRANTGKLQLKLDEAIIRETPTLESGQVALKVIAAVAPLLGLLGTVIGMIETFQDITLFGTSDPRLMADGISKALVTTMLGLLVAIPMVLIHSLVASRSKRLIEILEEQSAAIVAKQAEKTQ